MGLADLGAAIASSFTDRSHSKGRDMSETLRSHLIGRDSLRSSFLVRFHSVDVEYRRLPTPGGRTYTAFHKTVIEGHAAFQTIDRPEVQAVSDLPPVASPTGSGRTDFCSTPPSHISRKAT